MIALGVNIDHVATVRQARYRGGTGSGSGTAPGSVWGEPDPVHAAAEAEVGGADCITVHLREDRRHVQDRDLLLLSQTVRVKLNLEMAATEEMVRIATGLRPTRPHMCTLVPEGRQEVTTEGGLDVRGQSVRLRDVVGRLLDAGIVAAAFIDPDRAQVEAAAAAGFQACEVHTGRYAARYRAAGGSIVDPGLAAELEEIAMAGAAIRAAGMRFHAGHALDYANVARIAALGGVAELHIGHSIVSRAIVVGMRSAVAQMKEIILRAHRRTD